MKFKDYVKESWLKNISVGLVDEKSLKTKKTKIIKSNIPIKEFDAMAAKMGYTDKKFDNSLLGYYWAEPKSGNALQPFPPHNKEGEELEI